MEERSLFYPSAPSSFVLLAFFQFLFGFLTMPTNKRLSFNNKGAINIFLVKGGEAGAAAPKGSITKRRAEKNCAEDLEERHSGVPQLPLRVHATQNAGSGGCPRGSHQILNDF